MAAPVTPRPQTLAINGATVDLSAEIVIHSDGSAVNLRPQSFATLLYLISHPNRVVSKGELVDAVWNGAAVTDDSLVQCIHEIRKALRDDGHAVVQTAAKRGYRLQLASADPQKRSDVQLISIPPFRTISSMPQDEQFAEGLAEEVTVGLSKIRGLSVMGPDAVGSAPEFKLWGSVRRLGASFRVTVQIIEMASGVGVWAESFDTRCNAPADTQVLVASQIVGRIEQSIRKYEIDRAKRRSPDGADAGVLFLQAVPLVLSNSASTTNAALQLLESVLQRDPAHLPAHGYAAWCYEQKYLRAGFDPADRIAALRHADFALSVNSDDPLAIGMAAFVRANLTSDHDAGLVAIDRALAINANSSVVLGFSALVSAHSERFTRAIDHAEKALRLSPSDDPMIYHPYCALTVAHLFAGRYSDAARFASMTISANPGFSVPYAYLVAAFVGLGDLDRARDTAGRLMEVAPTFSASGFARSNIFRPPLIRLIVDALRQVDFPN